MKYILVFVLCGISHFLNAQIVDLTSYLPRSYSKKGDVDYTLYLQKGINENKEISMPNFPILINSKGLTVPSNRKIIFQPNSKLVLSPSNTRSYYMLNIFMANNVEIINPRLQGERVSKFNGKQRTGEWGMGIGIRASKNITVRGGQLDTFWGDGIYIGKNNENPSLTNENIIIDGTLIKNARRNGISIISANKLNIRNVKIQDIGGTSPQAALDIEPNGRQDVIKNIQINNIHTQNSRYGILISLRKLIDTKNQSVSIEINKHIDSVSNQAFRFAGFNKAYSEKNLKKITGDIRVFNATWIKNKGSFTYEDGKGYMPNLQFTNLLFKDAQGKVYNYEKWSKITKSQPNITFKK